MTFEEVLQTSGKLIYTNVGVSMMPLIRQGRDLMVIEAVREPLKKYDAVLFIRPDVEGRGKYVMHRILRVNRDGTYYIIGDNCESGEIVSREAVIGILTAVKRGEKTIHSTDFGYCLFVRLLWMVFPFRMAVRKCKRFIRRMLRR